MFISWQFNAMNGRCNCWNVFQGKWLEWFLYHEKYLKQSLNYWVVSHSKNSYFTQPNKLINTAYITLMVFLITSSESLLFDDVIRNIYNKHTIINKGYSACFKRIVTFICSYFQIIICLIITISKFFQKWFYYSFMAFKAFGCWF